MKFFLVHVKVLDLFLRDFTRMVLSVPLQDVESRVQDVEHNILVNLTSVISYATLFKERFMLKT